MKRLSHTGNTLFICLLFLSLGLTLVIVPPVIGLSQQTSPSVHPTPTAPACADEDYPAYQPGMIYLVKQDTNGHWLVVSTDNLCVAHDEQALGFYPVPESFAKQVAGR